MDILFPVLWSGERARNNASGICPDGIVASAVGIGKPIDDRTGTVFNIIESVKNCRGDSVAAYVQNVRRYNAGGIRHTGYGVNLISRYIGDGVRKLNMEGE